MDLLEKLAGLKRRLDYWRPRAVRFLRFVLRRFTDDKCFEAAGALSYTTLFALVPLAVVVFGVMSAFPVFDAWADTLRGFIFENFVPAAGDKVEEYVATFSDNASRLTATGIVVLIVGALLMMSSIEETYNRIWRVSVRRSRMARFVVYWTTLTLGPVLVVTGLAASSYFLSLPLWTQASQDLKLQDYLLRALPSLVTWLAFTLSYVVVPNRRVSVSAAAVGGLLAALLFEAAKRAFAFYLASSSYEQIYGALATLPIFLIWIYLSWVVVLLGASFSASLGAFSDEPRAVKLDPDQELRIALRILARFDQAQSEGRGLESRELIDVEPGLSDDVLQDLLGELHRMRVLMRTEDGGWMLARDLARMSLDELYRSSRFVLPLRKDQGSPHDPLDARIREQLSEVAGHARLPMQVHLGPLLRDSQADESSP